ncbi:L-fucose:H+ symporter permease [Terriglobus roseus DSM 18391]|uniref:L-fucose:H+ symporter permease n=1 Tax=Terriglobus roseus (strain DSM 18391 / NRRL B-41598 / KBS 63) TaxID=926566 RepID=I3ZIT5_TERRK|nr:L-fucose:H+ symporter permease [Terriglobus roseus]AFL89153.1 L-fucose:H+ symporter permease [Terriglobus roseus DSM 18391]
MPSAPVTNNPKHFVPGTDLLPAGTLAPFLLICGLFFLWGIPNSMNDVLIRQFSKSFEITRLEAGLVQWAFYLGYFVFALPAGLLMRKYGYRAGLIVGLLLFAVGCCLFLPAASAGRYAFFLTALFVVASGLSFLESAANPLIAQFGPTATSERRLNIAQAFNPIGTITGALVGTRFIFSGIELTPTQVAAMKASGEYAAYLHHETVRVVAPYLVLAGLVLLWAIFIAFTRFPKFVRSREEDAGNSANWRVLLRERHFLFALPTQFFYVGAQVGTWSYFIKYAQEYAHASERSAGLLLAGTLAAFGIGRFGSALLMKRIPASRLMQGYAVANVFLLAFGALHPGQAGLIAIFATSFFMSIMFPTIFALGIKDLGPNTNVAGSLLVMTIIGGGVLTLAMGGAGEFFHNTAISYLVPLVCYFVVFAYAFGMAGYQRRRAMQSTFEV